MPELSIQYDHENDILTVEGTQYAGELFRTMAFPKADRVYRFTRDGEKVILKDCGPYIPRETATHQAVTIVDFNPQALVALLKLNGNDWMKVADELTNQIHVQVTEHLKRMLDIEERELQEAPPKNGN